uniref:Uncharacterized protein n=1 Tax=Nephroselmis olivacea TaxID=31312 RepID=Q9TCC5_NEPOL|nr:hypothetical protein NeolPp04 [Nephroselmis olivacea]AAF03173.1 hypothetical protein [Nephroselmis olivacea]
MDNNNRNTVPSGPANMPEMETPEYKRLYTAATHLIDQTFNKKCHQLLESEKFLENNVLVSDLRQYLKKQDELEHNTNKNAIFRYISESNRLNLTKQEIINIFNEETIFLSLKNIDFSKMDNSEARKIVDKQIKIMKVRLYRLSNQFINMIASIFVKHIANDDFKKQPEISTKNRQINGFSILEKYYVKEYMTNIKPHWFEQYDLAVFRRMLIDTIISELD